MMKLLNEVFENPFDLGRFIKFVSLILHGPKRPNAKQLDQDQLNEVQPESGGLPPVGGVSVIKSFKCSEGKKIAVLSIRSEKATNLSSNGIAQVIGLPEQAKEISQILASMQCEAAVAAFYEDNVPEWRLSFIKLIRGDRSAGAIRAFNCGVKKTSIIMGAAGRREAADLTGIAEAAVIRQLKCLLRRKGQVTLRDIEKAFSYRVFTRNVIKDFNRSYTDAIDFSDITKLPGFKMNESGPYDRELAVDPEMLGSIFESRLKRSDRKNRGTFYTPSETVSFMCRESLAQYISNAVELPYEDCREFLSLDSLDCGPVTHIPVKPATNLPWLAAGNLKKIDRALQQVRIFDPAAGSGAFVLGMLKEITRARDMAAACISAGLDENRAVKGKTFNTKAKRDHKIENTTFIHMLHTVTNCIFAADIDEEAVGLTRLRLQCALASANEGGFSASSDPDQFCHVVCGDSLDDGADILKNDQAFYGVISEKGGFDIVIGNPPYISAVEGARHGNLLRDSLKAKYPELLGSFDIYTAFLLNGVRQTNNEGVYCWIVPNSLLASRYAKPVFEYLMQNGLERSISVSDIDIFHNVGVYPVIAIGNKKAQGAGYMEYVAASADAPGCASVRAFHGNMAYGTFKGYGIRIASGAAGFQAKALAGCIAQERKGLAIPFVVSGSIDKYSTDFKNVRYMGKTWSRAYITKSGDIAQSKWMLWCGEKIIIAGLTRELEADYSREPLALGVGAYAIYDFGGFDPLFLLGLLNSRFMSKYLRERFYEKHLAGGYLSINKATLEQLPLVPADPAMQKTIAEKVNAVKTLMKHLQRDGMEDGDQQSDEILQIKLQCKNLLAEIDELADRLYA